MKMMRVVIVTATLCFATGEAGAQSIFNSAGMGLPVEALDGRARALGSLGIGLLGPALTPTDPAAAARFPVATGVMAGQPSWVDYARSDGPSGSFQGNRFPLMGVAYPVFSGMMSIQIGAFLDQRYTSEASGSVDLATGTITTSDLFDQDGTVSTLNIGYAWMLGERTAVGATFGRYAGSVLRTLTRSFEATAGVEDYTEEGEWRYVGHSATLGASSDLTEGLRVAASVQIPTSLDAEASEETDGSDGAFDLPVQYKLGASARLSPGLALSASLALADWSSVADGLTENSTVGSANGFGVGLELGRARLLGKEAPLRFGYRRSGLPFSFNDSKASERIMSGGFGLVLNETNDIQLAVVDFAIERGRRTGGGVTEDFWRGTISLALSGS